MKTSGVLTRSQHQALAALPDLKDSKFPRVRDTLPAAAYVDPARFDREIALIYRQQPVIVAPSALLSAPSSYVQADTAGMPVLLTRGAEGEVKGFVNVCRHRGAKLCLAADPVEGARVVCPYHAWTYRLDGSLFAIPRQETFPGIEKKDLSLMRLPVVESGGFVWAGLDPNRTFDFSSVQGQIGEELDALGLGQMHVFQRTTFHVNANWKLVMDTMLDSYHVTRLHKDSLAKFFVDAENIIDLIGPHIRAAAARGNFSRDTPVGDFAAARKVMVFAYTLFPNGIVVVSPYFISVGILRPIATDRTDVDYFMMVDNLPVDQAARDKLQRSFELMQQAFGREDYWAAELCDAGLRSGTMTEVHLGGMEVQISLFHDAVNRCLGLPVKGRPPETT